MRYLGLVTKSVELKITALLPESFALIFDGCLEYSFAPDSLGWSHLQSTHYIALFATFMNARQDAVERVLLAFSPLRDESDYSAASHAAFILDQLAGYKKTIQNVVCLVGDNCNTNIAVAEQLGVPLVGCASHRFNLEVQEFLGKHERLLQRVHELMKKLTTLKNSALLRHHTLLRPKERCATRWSSAFEMVERFHLSCCSSDLEGTFKSMNSFLSLHQQARTWENSCCLFPKKQVCND